MKINFKKLKKIIYLDYAAATPIDINILGMMKSFYGIFANGSAIHKSGILARNAIENARLSIAHSICAHSDEIIFTGSGTESDALAILGVVNNYKLQTINGQKKVPHIITTNIEHSAVLENCKLLEKNGEAEVTYLKVNANGIINSKDVYDAIKENTVLVSVMYANNEIGTIQPIQEIAKVIRYFRKSRKSEKEIDFEKSSDLLASEARHFQNQFLFPIFHTDACQAMNYLPTENIEKLGVDLLTFNSSKIYGPKGLGVLFKKRGIILTPLYAGGGQEQGLRSGTENTIAIVGAALALEYTNKIKEKESKRLVKLRDYTINKLLSLSKTSGYEIILNGDKVNRLPNNINISIHGISSELLVIELDAKGIEVSERSACSSTREEGSHVIDAIRKIRFSKGQSFDKDIINSLRISLGRQTSKGDVDTLVKSFKDILVKYKQWK